jgi:hypothetical protein
LLQRSTMPDDGAGQDAVQTPPVWMLGCSVPPSRDRHIAEAMISPEPHSDAHPIEPQALLSTVLT